MKQYITNKSTKDIHLYIINEQ